MRLWVDRIEFTLIAPNAKHAGLGPHGGKSAVKEPSP
jgi:hypothetical protein